MLIRLTPNTPKGWVRLTPRPDFPKTLRETTKFLKTVTQDVFESPRSRLSINYIQALPGTPVYEYARAKGLIGRSLLHEEKYLIAISDIDAADGTKTLNFTSYDYLTVRSWCRRIIMEVMRHYCRHNKTSTPNFFSMPLSCGLRCRKSPQRRRG